MQLDKPLLYNTSVRFETEFARPPDCSRIAEMARRYRIAPTHVPVSTYRLQFNQNFTFNDATKLIDYFQELGITDLYASPFLMARPGSPHGYDVTNHSRFN